MPPRAFLACLALPSCLLLSAVPPAEAAGCDALTVRMIRATGASLAGRTGALAVFRAADAERMSLACGAPPQMLFRAREREPNRAYFVLIGRAAQGLTGADPEAVEGLVLRLHRDTLLTGEARAGRAGPAALRCEPGDRPDGFSDGTLCLLEPAANHPPGRALRSRAALPAPPGSLSPAARPG